MPDIYVITNSHLPKRLQGTDSGYALRSMTVKEVVSIEDRFFGQGHEIKLENRNDFS